MDIDGDTLAIGCRGYKSYTGAVFIYARAGTTWSLEQKIESASTNQYGESFALAIALVDNILFVGAPGARNDRDIQTGAVYVYVRSETTWTLEQTLWPVVIVPSSGNYYGNFGISLAATSESLIVGDNGDVESAYIFVRSDSSWTLQQKVVPFDYDDSMPSGKFGNSVAIHGNTAVVGAYRDDTSNEMDSGSVYVYARSGTIWTHEDKIIPSDVASMEQFGQSLALVDGTLIVGAQSNVNDVYRVGSARVYERAGNSKNWKLQQMLSASDASRQDCFGAALALTGETLVVGALRSQEGDGSGSAYVFIRESGTWKLQQKILSSNGMQDDVFGGQVAFHGNSVVVGASGENGNTGSVYLFAA